MAWRTVHTPGHTPQHLSYVVAIDGKDTAAFTGGSLLFGSVGRPDLIGPDHTARARPRPVAQRPAAHRPRSRPRPAVFPTHGFGSFCSATATVGLESTIGQQAVANPACTVDEDEFVTELIAGLDAYPAYYAQMGPANQAGPGPIDLSLPERADATELRRRIDAGEWVVDLRSRRVFAEGHLRGTLSFDGDGNAVTYLGWVIPWGTPADPPRRHARAGHARCSASWCASASTGRPPSTTGRPVDWAIEPSDVATYRRAEFRSSMTRWPRTPTSSSSTSRRRTEWQGGHVTGARHVPLHELRRPRRGDRHLVARGGARRP